MTLTLCSTNKFMKICDTQIIDFCRSQSVYYEENIIDGFQHGLMLFAWFLTVWLLVARKIFEVGKYKS